MPFNELQRRDSWPPTILRIRGNDSPTDFSTIDEDPISFFLTSPEDNDFFSDDDEDLSAGIETSDSSKPAVREISPSSLQRTSHRSENQELVDACIEEEQDEEEEPVDFGIAIPISLKDFTKGHGRKSRQVYQNANDDVPTGLGIAIPDFKAGRGRARVRLTPNGRGRGRSQTRSLSARRTQSWRVPSPDIYSIEEENEEEEKKKKDVNGTVYSASAPPTGQIEQVAMAKKLKPKKRVHWAF